MKALADQSHYEVLELTPGCPAAAVERGLARARELYGTGSLATYALAEPAEAAALLRRIEEAGEVLRDREQRRLYDLTNGFPPESASGEEERSHEGSSPAAPTEGLEGEGADRPAPTPNPAPSPVALAPAPTAALLSTPAATPSTPAALGAELDPKPVRKTESDLPPDAPVTGEALRRVREARGLSLKDLEARTKIGHWHLENIERERFAALPAQVYLRGFLMSIARELKLDPVRVAKGYLELTKTKSVKPE